MHCFSMLIILHLNVWFTGAGPPSPLKLSQLRARWNRAKHQIIISQAEFDTSLQCAS